jgi:DNA polymerase IV
MKIQPAAWPKKIIHIDMDAYYAAIEIRDRPHLKGQPVVIGNPNSRSVVSTASYEARKYGIHSAMSAAQAKKLCPHAVFLKPNFEKYTAASRVIMGILRQHTELMEPVSLDEAYLDVTKHRLGIEDPVMIAKLIKQNILAVTKLTASAGVAPNLFLAKIASDFKKPDGLTVIKPAEVGTFLENLPVRKIPGVGPVTEKELVKLGIKTCGDLALKDLSYLMKHFGKTGVFLHARAHGRDEREVEPNVLSKQSSCEETFERDMKDKNFLKSKLRDYAREVFTSLKKEGRMGKTVTLKVKYFDFELITRSKTLARAPEEWTEIYEVGASLLDTKTKAGSKAVRLLGLGVSGLEDISETPFRQMELF